MFKKTALIFILILFFGNILIPNFSFAQYGLEEGQQIQGISQSEPELFVGQIIKAVLLIIGVILIVLIIYGGITYATSMGNEDKIKKGKSILVYAIIGVIIIALAYAITTFVFSALFPKIEEPQPTGLCTCANGEQISSVSASDFNACYNACIDKGGPKDFLEKYGRETTPPIPTPPETCAHLGEKCLFSPSAEIQDGELQIEGAAPINACCEGESLDCDIITQTCVLKCAKIGESYIDEKLKREAIVCCPPGVKNEATGFCIKPRL